MGLLALIEPTIKRPMAGRLVEPALQRADRGCPPVGFPQATERRMPSLRNDGSREGSTFARDCSLVEGPLNDAAVAAAKLFVQTSHLRLQAKSEELDRRDERLGSRLEDASGDAL